MTDTRTRNWDGGRVVELDAVEPHKLEQMCRDAIMEHFDSRLNEELEQKEDEERVIYQSRLKEFVNNIE